MTNKILKAARMAAVLGELNNSRVEEVKHVGPGICHLLFEDKSQQEIGGKLGGFILSGDKEAVKRYYA